MSLFDSRTMARSPRPGQPRGWDDWVCGSCTEPLGISVTEFLNRVIAGEAYNTEKYLEWHERKQR